ncbi:MAG: DHH family phosphoesterase, partial [Clostridia bacterium]|nr:DHH family phosphoesterase [Clostridia bacterium]
MKSRYKQREFNFDFQDIKVVSERFGFDDQNDFLLKKFGVNSDVATDFFSDGEKGLLDPFLMKNMDIAVEKINFAKENNHKILIFGDYDADGISAAAILKLFFDETGIDSFVYLPKRSEGYGLKIETLMRLYKEEKFDLVVTVDCGITAVDEVEFIKKILRVDVLVTDHHEPGEKLPNCVCINPKLGYPFRDLSGSGVALKLVQALSSYEVAKSFCDLASIGTIADIMPMESENRAIVKIACRNVNNLGLKELLIANKIEINKLDCNSMAIKVCPKINAAGRVDEPMVALDLLLAQSDV